jgi:UDP-N-acetylmuramate dehydrogenase
MNVEDLYSLSRALTKIRVPVVVVGRGSNILVSDSGFRGIAVTLGPFTELISLPTQGETPIVIAGAMAPLPVLARQTVHHGLSGFEWAVGVPGSLGGAVRMNAGGHGADMIASLLSVRLFHLERGIEANVSAANLGLRFRGSDLTDEHIVISATLRLNWGDTIIGQGRLSEIVKWRRENQPGGQNAGSVFVNPVAGVTAAGELIDGLGLRGYRIGSASVSDKHANFIQADEGGSGDDVAQLMTFVRQRVFESHGVELRSEIRLIGFSTAVSADAGAPTLSQRKVGTQLDEAFGVSTGADLSIPIPAISERLPENVLAELKDAFEGNETPISNLRIVRPDVHIDEDLFAEPVIDQGESVDDQTVFKLDPQTAASDEASGAASTATSATASSDFLTQSSSTESAVDPVASIVSGAVLKTTKDDSDRIIIIDAELRLPTDITFPIDALTESVNIAPTSDPAVLIDDLKLEDSDEPDFKKKRTKKSTLILGSTAVGLFVVLALVVLSSPLVGVRRIEVEGTRYMSKELLDSVKNSLIGKPLLTVDTRQAESQLLVDPWVETVRVQKFLPSQILIEVAERVPVAWFVGSDNSSRIVDSQGRVLAVESGQPTEYLQITGVGPNLEPGVSAGDIYRAAAQLATGLPTELSEVVLNVGTGGPNQLVMTLRSGTLVNFGPPQDVQNKLISLVVLLRRQDAKQIIFIDLTNPDIPTVQSK